MTTPGGNPTGKIRVVVADDHDLFRRGVVEMLSYADGAEGVEVVGEAADHDAAVETVFREVPDVVLLDLEMPGMGADESMRRMLALPSPPKVVVFTMHDEPGMVGRFLGRGGGRLLPQERRDGRARGGRQGRRARPRGPRGHGVKAGRWPAGGGEMARRIREHDWSRTPLGPIEAWPQSLKTAAEMVLGMPGPATILWGPRHVQLYNDAYIAVARDRHPGLLGRPAEEGWPDAYEGTIAPLLP